MIVKKWIEKSFTKKELLEALKIDKTEVEHISYSPITDTLNIEMALEVQE